MTTGALGTAIEYDMTDQFNNITSFINTGGVLYLNGSVEALKTNLNQVIQFATQTLNKQNVTNQELQTAKDNVEQALNVAKQSFANLTKVTRNTDDGTGQNMQPTRGLEITKTINLPADTTLHVITKNNSGEEITPNVEGNSFKFTPTDAGQNEVLFYITNADDKVVQFGFFAVTVS